MADRIDDKTRKRDSRQQYEPYSNGNPDRKCQTNGDQRDGLLSSIEKKLTDKRLEEEHDKVEDDDELSTKEVEEMCKKGLITKTQYELLLELICIKTDKTDGLLSSFEKKLTDKPIEEAQDKVDGKTSFESHEELKLKHYHDLSIKELKEIFKKGLITKKQYKLLLRQCELVRKSHSKQRDQVDGVMNKPWEETTQKGMDM